jgi:hypothetical protein
MAAADGAGPQDPLLSHLQPRDVAALRCSGSCFMEVEPAAAVDVAVTVSHLIFIVSHQGTHASRLAWADVAAMHVSTSPQRRLCAVIEFLARAVVHPAAAAPAAAASSPKLTKVAQLKHADSTARASEVKSVSAGRSAVADGAPTAPLTLYIENTQSVGDNGDNFRSVVIASQRAFLYHHFHRQTRSVPLANELQLDDAELLQQYSALEHDIVAAASIENVLLLLEELEDGARILSIKRAFFQRPLILNLLTKQLSAFRQQSSQSLSGAHIRVATAVLHCISSIVSDAYSAFDASDAIACSSAERCLMAAAEPLATELHLSDVASRVALAALLRTQVEAVFHCLFLCFCSPAPAPLAPFLSARLSTEQITSFVASTV